MTAREQLQWAYELAFHPARLNAAWNQWEKGAIADLQSLRSVLDWALSLHQMLPEAPAVSARALRRLAGYQANARMYRLTTMLRRFRGRVEAIGEIPTEVPAWMVRDIGLPRLERVSDARRAKSPVGSPPDTSELRSWRLALQSGGRDAHHGTRVGCAPQSEGRRYRGPDDPLRRSVDSPAGAFGMGNADRNPSCGEWEWPRMPAPGRRGAIGQMAHGSENRPGNGNTTQPGTVANQARRRTGSEGRANLGRTGSGAGGKESHGECESKSGPRDPQWQDRRFGISPIPG